MGLLRKIIRGREDNEVKQYYNDDTVHPWTIYGKNLKMSEWSRKFHYLDSTVKIRFIYPFVALADKVLGTKVNSTPDKSEFYDKNIVGFDAAWENTMKDLEKYFKPNIGKSAPCSDMDNYTQRMKTIGTSRKLLETLKRYVLAFVLEDSSYREFFNILLLNIALEMNKIHGKKANHILYTSNSIVDINYYMVGKMADGNPILFNLSKGGKNNGKNNT